MAIKGKALVKDITPIVGDSNFVIVGDIHGCLDELKIILDEVLFDPAKDHLISLGDLTDRGPKSREVMDFVISLPNFHCVMGNHDHRLMRYMKGNNVKISHGLAATIEQMEAVYQPQEWKAKFFHFVREFPHIIKLKDMYLVHAGFNPKYHPEAQCESDCLFMRYFGGKDYFDDKNGLMWYEFIPDDFPKVLFGHEVHLDKLDIFNNGKVLAMDGGCVFGGELRAFHNIKGVIRVQSKSLYSGTVQKPVDAMDRSRESFNENKPECA